MGDLQAILSINRPEEPLRNAAPEPSLIDANEPPAKRARQKLACNACRQRKTKCSGERPICEPCLKRRVGSTCSYERERKPTSAGHDDHNSSFLLESPISIPAKRGPDHPTNERRYVDHAREGQRLPTTGDALSLVKSRHDESMYGPSSTIAFMSTISGDSKSDEPARSEQYRTSRTPNPRASGPQPPEKLFTSSTAPLFPRRREADEFIRCYWEFVHPLWPLIHKTTFMEQYERMWASENDFHQSEFEETLFISALNLVFAIGCKFSPTVPQEHRKSMAEEFYQRSRKMFCYDMLDAASLSMLQLLLLTVIYLQSTHYASRTWNSLGLAIRAAQSLGIFVESPDRNQSQLQLEMHRRIWHVCVALDRLSSMTFGRPFGIQKHNVPIPSLIDDEYISTNRTGHQPLDKIPQLGMFVHSCALFDILHDVLLTLYTDQSSKPDHAKTLDAVMHSNRRLDELASSLPHFLQISEAQIPAYIRLQQQVMYCRFLYVRLLCTRPLLIAIAQRKVPFKTKNLSLDDTLTRRCAEQCIDTAHDLIATIYTHLMDIYRSSAWHTTYFTCAALMVLLKAHKSSLLDTQETQFEASWNLGLSILDYHRGDVQSAVDGMHILQGLKQRISKSNGEATNGNAYQHGPAQTPASINDATKEPVSSLDLNADIMDIIEMDNIGDAWFSQHLLDSNWLEL